MNFALSAILLAILLMPGVAVFRAYYSSFREKASSIFIPTNELLIKGLLYSVIIHSFALFIISVIGIEIKSDILYSIIVGDPIKLNSDEFNWYIAGFLAYNISLYLFAWTLTKAFKRVARYYRWDVNFFALRNKNYWFRVFSAGYLEEKGIEGKKADVDFIFVDLLCKNNTIYSGILNEFNYSPEKDKLEIIVLKNAVKRSYIKDNDDPEHTTEKECLIPGDILVISMDEIININVHYIELDNINQLQNGGVEVQG